MSKNPDHSTKPAKPLASPFPAGHTFNSVARFHWDAKRGGAPFEADIGPNGAVVIDFVVPDGIGTTIHGSVSLTDQRRAFNISEGDLDFNGAIVTYGVSPSYMVVSANDPDAGSHAPITRPGKTRDYIPLVAGRAMKCNIANMDQIAGKIRVQMST